VPRPKARVEELPQKPSSLVASSDSAAWPQYADDAEKNNQTLGKLAPSEIKSDDATLEQAPVAVIKAIRDANGDISQIRIGLPRSPGSPRARITARRRDGGSPI
jgi:hypothetical protein